MTAPTTAPVTPRSAVPTFDDPTWTPLRVRVDLDEPLVGDLHRPLWLDGVLAWCAYLAWVETTGHRPPPVRPHESPLDFPLPLATWTAPSTAQPVDGRALGAGGLAWGWACTPHIPVPAAHTAVATRRRPPVDAMARYSPDRRQHLGAGPYKARDHVHPAAWIGAITWWALGDPQRVADLLVRARHIGRLGRHGYGRIRKVEVTEHIGRGRDVWRARPMPGPGPVQSIRAPHYHPTRKMPCRPA